MSTYYPQIEPLIKFIFTILMGGTLVFIGVRVFPQITFYPFLILVGVSVAISMFITNEVFKEEKQ